MDKNNFVRNEMGICPICGKSELDYIESDFIDNFMVYQWVCLDCAAMGQEIYELTFITHEEVSIAEE